MPKIGAHVSTAGSLTKSFKKAKEIGAECTQIFITPPQQWIMKNYSEFEIVDYKLAQIDAGIGPNFIHSAYLINLASANLYIYQQSINWLAYSQNVASSLGIEGTIFHIGSSGKLVREDALNQVIKAISKILESTKKSSLIIETAAGAGNTIGDEFSEIGFIMKAISDERLKVALDTQHVFASGYDIKTTIGLEKIIDLFDREVGLKNLVAIHANDSKTELGSNKDRHENIGEGEIGLEGFRNIINHKVFEKLPFILETPGFNKNGPDKENIQLLKSLIDSKE